MNIYVTYLIIAAVLVVAELVYFRIADRFNIIDKPNERSSHTKVVLRGGGDYICAGDVDICCILRRGDVAVPAGSDAGGGCQFRG